MSHRVMAADIYHERQNVNSPLAIQHAIASGPGNSLCRGGSFLFLQVESGTPTGTDCGYAEFDGGKRAV